MHLEVRDMCILRCVLVIALKQCFRGFLLMSIAFWSCWPGPYTYTHRTLQMCRCGLFWPELYTHTVHYYRRGLFGRILPRSELQRLSTQSLYSNGLTLRNKPVLAGSCL